MAWIALSSPTYSLLPSGGERYYNPEAENDKDREMKRQKCVKMAKSQDEDSYRLDYCESQEVDGIEIIL